ncbi:ethanolamine kinase [Suhomyces tanzawaensis NRRL Y-17324]|uniref:ethanolamine kinase n=1 Tax=Suhomyces tanzawaensis NRRL Y-17324 TaxID=984487 RepID=A0A1E4SRG5_9ASCO|nr:ethanolamine kinase [Suhomyces tanzawaensis NRRL Y-17324]ODV82088.1 ethanolamine kinase [Suhomyces tanzawaensis NRRL Y-17324]
MSFETVGNHSSSAYCFISNNSVHCVPVNSFNTFSDNLLNESADDYADFTPDKLYLKNKNLLYSLNNPSLSDVEVESSPSLQNSSLTSTSALGAVADDSLTLSSVSVDNNRLTSIINNYSTHAVYLPKLVVNLHENLDNDFVQLRGLLSKVFPSWTEPEQITFKKLTGGITNMLLSCKYMDDRVLIRVYGHGTNLIIDRHREFILHLILNSLNLAPAIHSRFKNGLVYGFLPGRSLDSEELNHENLFPLIAQQLGNWHSRVPIKVIEEGLEKLRGFSKKLKAKGKLNGTAPNSNVENGAKPAKKPKKRSISNLWELIEDWINIVPVNSNLIASFNNHLDVEVNETNLKEIIGSEFEWLKNVLEKSNSPTVVAHCDLLSGNVIVPDEFDLESPLKSLPSLAENPIKFIDYEYMLPAPRAFDIANHLAEWQGFQCDRSRIPTPEPNNPTLTKWVKGYLNNENATSEEVNELIQEISTFYGLPGFYWGIWAMIQHEISNIDFDYSNYGKSRLQEYWDWKAQYLNKTV